MMSMRILLAFIFLLTTSQYSDAQFEDYCVSDEQAPDDQLFWTMNWVCSNGANCTAIQENNACFFPNTTKDHASYAFNNYYQNMKHTNGASCYFSSAAVLTGLDPSHDSCKFEYIP